MANASLVGGGSLAASTISRMQAAARFAGATTLYFRPVIPLQVVVPKEVTVNDQIRNVEPFLLRLLDNLAATILSQTGNAGISLRTQLGYVRANYGTLIQSGNFASELLACFTATEAVNVSLLSLDNVLNALFVESPVTIFQKAFVQASISFCLSMQCRLITAIEFVSRDDVDTMMVKMKTALDTARELAADANDSNCYQALIFLSGALTAHLVTTAQPLPRMLNFTMPTILPALALSQRIYYTAERWEELMQENKSVIHPAFCPREIRGLST